MFELVNLDWYRSDTVATSDPSSSSTDLWLHFKCFYSSQGYADISELEEVIEEKVSDTEEEEKVINI